MRKVISRQNHNTYTTTSLPTQCRNSDFLREINYGELRTLQNCHFDNYRGFVMLFFQIWIQNCGHFIETVLSPKVISRISAEIGIHQLPHCGTQTFF